MKNFFLLLFLITALSGSTFTDQDELAFYEQLQVQLKASETKLHKLVAQKASNNTTIAHHQRLLVDAARCAFETKHMLYSNFYDTPSIQSPEVRKKLLNIFKANEVTTDDLQDLQTAVFQWRQKGQGQ